MAINSPRASVKDHPVAPQDWPNLDREWLRKVAEVLNNALLGRTNNTGKVTLAASTTTTTITDKRIGAGTKITLSPTTANAATATANAYVSSVGKETATLTHANNAETDRTFGYVLNG